MARMKKIECPMGMDDGFPCQPGLLADCDKLIQRSHLVTWVVRPTDGRPTQSRDIRLHIVRHPAAL